jgi:hypothetical protein
MQNDYASDGSSSGDSAPLPADNAQPGHIPFTITPKDGEVLEQYLDAFKAAKTKARADITEKAMAELYQLRPPDLLFDKKDASLVCVYHLHINALDSYWME